MKLNFIAAALATAVVAAGTAQADEIVLAPGETFAFTNAEAVTQTDAVRVSDRATLEMAGTGVTTLKTGTFTENAPVTVNVRAGAVRIEESDPLVTSYPEPTDVLNRAAFWVDASKASTLALRDGSSDEVAAWLDVRETGNGTEASPYAYVRAIAFTNDYLTAFPQAAAFQEKAGVWFRGQGRGCFMDWTKPDGSHQKFANLRHVFVVHGVVNNYNVGDVLGGRVGEGPTFLHNGSTALWMRCNLDCEALHAAHTFLNGAEVDGSLTGYDEANALYLVEVGTDVTGDPLIASCFFNDRDFQWKGTDGTRPTDVNGVYINPVLGNGNQLEGGDRLGGDYIHEVVLFTNDLTTAERMAVSDWLNQKWRGVLPPSETPSVSVTLAAGAAFEAGAGAVLPDVVAGDGALRKTGAGALELAPAYAPRSGALRLEVAEGTVRPNAAVLPLACTAGDTVAAALDLNGIEVAAPTAGADATKLVKTGGGAITLDAIPAGVTRLEVKEGSLRLADPEALSTGSWEIPNGGFEQRETGFDAATFSTANAACVTGYAITQRTGDVSTAEIHLSTFSAKGVSKNRYFNLAWNRADSETQCILAGGGPTLTIAFTPPAGTWRFRADFSSWATDFGGVVGYAVAAKLTVGETEIDLGTVSTESRALLPRTWPNEFTADGATHVTLTLTGVSDKATAHGILDNLTLVRGREPPENLFADGGFEKTNDETPWSVTVTPKPPLNGEGSGTIAGSDAYPFAYDLYAKVLTCGSKAEGKRCRSIVNDDALYQTVTFAEGGLYRLAASFLSRSNLSGDYVYFGAGRNPVAFYFARDGVTNWVYRTDDAATTNYVEHATLVRIPEGGGMWDVGFRGTCVWDGGATSVDRTTFIDAAQLYRVEAREAIGLPQGLEVVVSPGAKLALDFAGTNVVSRLRIGGKPYRGIVSLETHPELFGTLSGCGALDVRPKGLAVIVR